MKRDTFERLKKLGIDFDDDFENLIVKPLEKLNEDVKISHIQYLKKEQKNDSFVNFTVKIFLSSPFFYVGASVEIDGRTFQAYRKNDRIDELNVLFVDVYIDFSSVVRFEENFLLTAKLIDFEGKGIDTKTITIKVRNNGDIMETNNIEQNVSKNSCYCDRDITPDEFEKILYELRANGKSGTKVSIKLFQEDNCELRDDDKTLERVLYQLNATLNKYGITQCIHKIHFLAQIYHETDKLKTTLEYATNKDYKPYFGRGAMQLTHKSNYKIYTAFYNKDSGTENDFVENYSIIAENLYHVFNSAGWYWNQGKVLTLGKMWKPSSGAPEWLKKGDPSFPKKEIKYTYKKEKEVTYGTIDFNLIAEQDFVDVISYLVNGGGNGLEERRRYVKNLKTLFNYENCINK